MASERVERILEELKALSLLEAAELVKSIEEVFGVKAEAPMGGGMPMMMAAMPAAPAAAEAAAPVEEQTEFTVILEEVPADKKIGILKVAREITGLGLKEAKDLVEAAPKPVKEGVNKEDAASIKKKLEEAGAKASIK
jgi:large subunit ribosomal protein L7/L12